MSDPAGERRRLAGLTDEQLARTALLVLRADAFQGIDSRAADRVAFEFRARGREADFDALVEQVRDERKQWRRWNWNEAQKLRQACHDGNGSVDR